MRFDWRRIMLTAGCLLMIGGTELQAQAAAAYYYPAPGDYATTLGPIHIPTAGYYYNIPLLAVPGPGNLATPSRPVYVSYPSARPGAFLFQNRYDAEPDHDWQFRGG